MERAILHHQAVKNIERAVLQTRQDFVGKYRRGTMGSKLLTYEPQVDQATYATLKQFEHQPDRNAYLHVRNEMNAYTQFQLETFLGERLNVGLSQFRYDLRDGVMYGQGMSESLLDMIERGRNCRDAVADDIDKPRQDAEVTQFGKIQQTMGNPNTQIGTTMISISPPGEAGSAYAHNFYDVFVLSEDSQTQERFVAGHRYASELSLSEYQRLAGELVPGYFNEYNGEQLDSYFLSHPLTVDVTSSLSGNPDAVHAYLHKGHDYLSTENFQEVKQAVAGLIVSYINTLIETPDDLDLLKSNLNYLMHSADNVADNLRRPIVNGEARVSQAPVHVPIGRAEMIENGKKQVRSVATGCGDSSSFEVGKENRLGGNMSSFSSMYDFGSDKLGSRTFHCPDCGEMNLRPLNETLKECQNCHSTKVTC